MRALEEALRVQWVHSRGLSNELKQERARYEELVSRVGAAQPGPMSDLELIVEAIELGGATPDTSRNSGWTRQDLLRRYSARLESWVRGAQIAGHHTLDPDIDHLRRMKAEQDRLAAEQKERFEADIAVARALVQELKLTKAQREAHLMRAQRVHCDHCGAKFKPNEAHNSGCPNDSPKKTP